MDHNHFLLPQLPYELVGVPHAAWGIAYDIYTRRTEDDLPAGWHSYRANTYKQLVRSLQLAQYFRSQYSDYLRPNVDVLTTWLVMLNLMNIEPYGKMESTVKHLKMYTMDRVHLQDVSFQVRLGGEFATRVRAPTPRNLVQPVILLMDYLPHLLANLVRRPRFTRWSNAANNPQNWAMM
ncbi:hypothetical protein Clacol_002157 [Clathrus columnatus]|uniref:Uncharacterized protein n=1 Tax=Clathrus columnatus TaxID=1419009 RepID=A0AAV5A119_9AGAM|nr:hypothetical protein Clacol_002157 [Clathrus columnatus]